jgi:hypothetical protein
MPTSIQYEIVKQQVNSFSIFPNVITRFDISDRTNGYSPKIFILYKNKSYRFSDPDWDIVSKQLTALWVKIKYAQLQQ